MKEINVTIGVWYVVEGAAGDTVTNPSTGRPIATVEDGKQTSFYATTAMVVASSDSVQVYRANFKSAPAKLKLLGLLGGGSTNTLPAGYLAADFLEGKSSKGQFIKLNHSFSSRLTYKIDAQYVNPSDNLGYLFGCSSSGVEIGIQWYNEHNEYVRLVVKPGSGHINLFPYREMRRFKVHYNGGAGIYELDGVIKKISVIDTAPYPFMVFAAGRNGGSANISHARIWNVEADEGGFSVNLIPALNQQGVPCMFDKVTKTPFFNSGSGSFIVGFSIAQARKLSRLPATGGTLTISLPEGYESDSGVAAALETARANGWTLTIQTYTPETATAVASTFALRRIWVRRTQDANGTYVDASGSRWMVDWCVDMLTPDGSTPDAHGYELFRSVEAAVAYWELTPWVDPEAEELLTNSTTNEHE